MGDLMVGGSVFGVPWIVGSAVALVIAIVFMFVRPPEGAGVGGIILRFGHSACWLLLAVAALLMSEVTTLPAAYAPTVAALAGIAYAAFLAALFIRRR